MATSKEMTKDKRISRESSRLKRLLKSMPANTLQSAAPLIKNAAFMTITLEDLQAVINEHGAVSQYKNGENQFGTKKSPEVEIYNTMIKNYSSIIKQLTDLLPDIPPPTPLPPPKKQDAFEKILARSDGD